MRWSMLMGSVAAGTLAASVASGATIFYEPFDDISGWTSVPAWGVETGSLSYNNGGPLITSGNSARKVAGSSGDFLRRELTLPIADGNTYWVAMLLKVTAAPSANREFGFRQTGNGPNRLFLNWDPSPGTGGVLFLGTRDAGGDPADGNATTNTNPTLTLGVTNLILFRIDAKPGNDDVWVWLNPAIGGAAPSVSTAFGSSIGIDNVATAANLGHFFIGGSNSADFVVDELRIGTTFESVTPVPEPRTLAALPLVGLLAMRRRRA